MQGSKKLLHTCENKLVPLTLFTQAKVSDSHKAICIHQQVVQLQVPSKQKGEKKKNIEDIQCNKESSQALGLRENK